MEAARDPASRHSYANTNCYSRNTCIRYPIYHQPYLPHLPYLLLETHPRAILCSRYKEDEGHGRGSDDTLAFPAGALC